MTLEEAKALMQPTAVQHLNEMVSESIVIDVSKKSACDILMSALCRAVTEEGVIKKTSLNEYFIKMLNSATNTLSQTKLGDLFELLHTKQPNVVCIFTLWTPNMDDTINEWVFKTTTPTFNAMYEFIIKHFEITPQMIREKLSEKLKHTIANNVAQFALKYSMASDKERSEYVVSITTITRLVNMMGYIITCEFKEV